jgi:hypothetical protein
VPRANLGKEEIMPVRFDCPSCKANYEVDDGLAGKMIMCRVCKKRGAVRSLTAASPSQATSLAAAVPAASGLSRRNFLPLAGLFVASLGAIGVGALLARQPWDRGTDKDDRRFRGFPPPPRDDQKDGKDNKGSAV